jgi:hypothetical protein
VTPHRARAKAPALTAVERVNIRLNKKPLLIIQFGCPSGARECFGDVVSHDFLLWRNRPTASAGAGFELRVMIRVTNKKLAAGGLCKNARVFGGLGRVRQALAHVRFAPR